MKPAPLNTIDFGDLGLGDAMMAWAGLYALLYGGLRPAAPGCLLYVPQDLAGLARFLFEPHGIDVHGVIPFHPRPHKGSTLSPSPPKTPREWWRTFCGPDWRMNCFEALDRQKSFALSSETPSARQRLRLFLTERILNRRQGWRAAMTEYVGCRIWRPYAQRLGILPVPLLMLMKRSLPPLRAQVALYVDKTSQGREPAPPLALFPVGKAFQAFPPDLCLRICERLPKTQYVVYIQASDPWISQYRAAGLEPRTLNNVEDLFWIVRSARRVLTTDSFASHVAQTLRDDFVLALTRDIAENVIHPGAYPEILASHPPCSPCNYLARADSATCLAGHATCLAFNDAAFVDRLVAALIPSDETSQLGL